MFGWCQWQVACPNIFCPGAGARSGCEERVRGAGARSGCEERVRGAGARSGCEEIWIRKECPCSFNLTLHFEQTGKSMQFTLHAGCGRSRGCILPPQCARRVMLRHATCHWHQPNRNAPEFSTGKNKAKHPAHQTRHFWKLRKVENQPNSTMPPVHRKGPLLLKTQQRCCW